MAWILGWVAPAWTLAAERPLPPFEDVVRAVGTYFSGINGFRQGDLVNQSQVSQALQVVADLGWEVPDAADLIERALPESNFLVRQMSSESGRSFMRKVGAMPNGYGQLERLSDTHDGQKHITYLIEHKDGHLMLKYMTTTPGGRGLQRQMTNVPGGSKFDQPTNRIYKAEQLLAELKLLHTAHAAALGR
jgi:hypothetical protein